MSNTYAEGVRAEAKRRGLSTDAFMKIALMHFMAESDNVRACACSVARVHDNGVDRG
jgi:hypothetical protein